ncbi:sulfite exporter TauE/SafE family protein [Seleniivibrio woodruffii]|uniref:sulfite exporter TauE/SafE family protein n=1 Tax=Seleniivibrio woodruffii TaxID=1078050 RepID=UPI0026E9F3F7|nr:sulfite exporter TauE/SafE family protein [Seleniivibrio woodruffii]
MTVILLLIVGFVTGIIGALLGIGGGSIIVPILVLFFDVPMHYAVAVGLMTIVSTSTAVVPVNIMKGFVNLRFSIFLETLTVLAAFIGGMVGNHTPEHLLEISFGLILFLIALLYVRESFKKSDANTYENSYTNRFSDEYFDTERGEKIKYTPVKLPMVALVSSFAGFASGSLGIGGGVIKVPVMNLVSRIPIKVSIATSNYMIGLTAAAGSIPYLIYGKSSPVTSITMVLGVIFGSRLGASKFQKVTDKRLRIMFAVVLAVIAVQMFYKGIQ